MRIRREHPVKSPSTFTHPWLSSDWSTYARTHRDSKCNLEMESYSQSISCPCALCNYSTSFFSDSEFLVAICMSSDEDSYQERKCYRETSSKRHRFGDISSQELSFYCFSTSFFDFWFSSLAFHPHTTELVRPIERSNANPQIINVNTSRGEFVTSGFEVQRGISELTVSLSCPS
jgi:hypothetical protein